MLAEVKAHIFEPFFSSKLSGSLGGLGLSMAFDFIKQSNGHIGIYSAPGRGSTVRLCPPRMDAGVVIDHRAIRPQATQRRGPPAELAQILRRLGMRLNRMRRRQQVVKLD